MKKEEGKKKATTTTKKTTVKRKGKQGPPKGKTNNPNGRPKGSKNKISYDIRKMIYDKVADDKFIKSLFTEIEGIDELDKKVKLKIELVKLFVPRPMNDDETKDRDIKSAIFDRLSGKKSSE